MSSLGRRAWLSAAPLAAAALASAGCRRDAEREGGRVVVSLWFSYGGKNREVLLELVRRFNEGQARVLVRPTYQGDYFEALAKVRTALAAGVAPALTHVVGEVVPYLAEAGVLEPLSGYEGARDLGLLPPLDQAGSFDAAGPRELFALPFNRSVPLAYLNGSLVPAAQAPRTWADLRALARDLTRRGGGGEARFGFEVPISWWFWAAMAVQAGGELLGPAGEPTLGGEAGVEALAFWQTLAHRDRTMRPPAGRDYNAWQVTNQDFLAGRAATIWTSAAFLRYLEENASFPVVAAPLPAHARPAAFVGGTFFVLLRQAPPAQKEAAWAFLRWVCGPGPAAEWAERTGYLPVSRGAYEQMLARGFYEKHPNDRAALAQLEAAHPWPWRPELFRVEREIVEPRLERAVLLDEDPRAALDAARRAAREDG
ncbi:MAG TPA: ABC transporter substrate-binding protein [Polyangiaceae bacterium]|nr:ABC transporter substrate-binding protein [Polyangiaceae bacterium]